MQIGSYLKKAMIDRDIANAKHLSELSGLTYNKVIRALNNDESSRISDIRELAKTMDLELKLVPKTN